MCGLFVELDSCVVVCDGLYDVVELVVVLFD